MKPTKAKRLARKRAQARIWKTQIATPNKYRQSSIGCLRDAHNCLRQYRDDKGCLEDASTNGAQPWHMALLARARRCGGATAYLEDLLAAARYHLASARSFQKIFGQLVP